MLIRPVEQEHPAAWQGLEVEAEFICRIHRLKKSSTVRWGSSAAAFYSIH